MKHIKQLLWLISLSLILIACGGSDVEIPPDELPVTSLAASEADSDSAAEMEADSAVPTVATVATVPPPTETPVPLPPTQTPVVVPTAVPAVVPPEHILLDYGSGDYGNAVLMKIDDELVFEPLPAELGVEIFFDYSADHGLLAFGRVFWEAAGPESHSVSDLWVYDFKTDQLTQWFEGNIGRAAWSSDPTQPPTLAIAQHNGAGFDLILAQQPETFVNVERGVLPHFSWAPGQSRLAFIKDGQLLAVNPLTQSIQKTGTADMSNEFGWIGDAPIWNLRDEALIYPDNPLLVAPLNGSASFVPSDGEGALVVGTRPTKMLWSAETRQLVTQVEDFASSVQVYLFSPDLQRVDQIITIDNVQLAFWYEPEISIVLLDELGENPQVWSLIDYDFVNP